VLLLNQSEIVIAQAKIQSEFTIDVDAVLNVTGMGVFKGVAIGIALAL